VCKFYSFILREEHRLEKQQSEVLRRIFGAKKEEVTGGNKNRKRGFS
jgi:hypothetical protein